MKLYYSIRVLIIYFNCDVNKNFFGVQLFINFVFVMRRDGILVRCKIQYSILKNIFEDKSDGWFRCYQYLFWIVCFIFENGCNSQIISNVVSKSLGVCEDVGLRKVFFYGFFKGQVSSYKFW